jgi:hypothetical protein
LKPVKGLVCSSSQGKLIVELENGETAQFQKRDGLKCGDCVYVGFDIDKLEYNHIMPKTHPAVRENHDPPVEVDPVDEDMSERMDSSQFNGVSLTGFEDDEGLEGLEVDDFEVLRTLLQGSEDIESSNGE